MFKIQTSKMEWVINYDYPTPIKNLRIAPPKQLFYYSDTNWILFIPSFPNFRE